ncbi:MAG: PilZ domain-containing protein [Candidatus Sulfotelmatobacter sp.]
MFDDYLKMHAINTRRWPRYHVRLPVYIAAKTGAESVAVPGLVSEVSRSGMELYGGVDLHPGDVMEVEFQTPGGMRIAGVVRNRSGFCFGLEFSDLWAESDAAPDVLESLILERHEAFLREVRQKINRSLQMAVEMRKFRAEIETLAKDEMPD